MIQPIEMKASLPMALSEGVVSTTTRVWETLVASRDGDLDRLHELIKDSPGLVYAQYNYTPPIHFAVREGHSDLVHYLLGEGALDPAYITYPFKDTLITIAEDRDYHDIAVQLEDYVADPARCRFRGDNGEIHYRKSEEQQQFQRAVNTNETAKVEQMLKEHPEFALDQTASWGEGILMMPANNNNRKLLELLMSYGARVPKVSKWGRFYYFKHYDIARFLLENGMNANHMTWHRVTLLHDMAQEGDVAKARLLLDHGADINPVEEEYQSTPLGLASRWGHPEMVELLLERGAHPNKSGAAWSTPLAWAQKKGHAQIEKILQKAGAK